MRNRTIDQLKYRKDSSPRATIKRIKQILAKLNIFVREASWESASKYCHSVRIETTALAGLGTNGKGMTKSLALASAYAEFMERLQNLKLYYFPRKFGLMSSIELKFPDQKSIDLKTMLKEKKHLLECFIEPPVEKVATIMPKITCVPYYNVTEDNVEYLPWKLIDDYISTTNGMCAGNTPAEAIVAGLCEIMERYALKRIYSGNGVGFPTISHDDVKKYEIYGLIEDLEKKGFKILIKDCTLDGKIPVLGIILIDKKGKYSACFGSDPDFEIALQRCITEMFQGTNCDEIHKSKMSGIDLSRCQYQDGQFDNIEYNRLAEQFKSMKSGSGKLPNNLFFSTQEPSYKNAFLWEKSGNATLLRFAVNLIHQFGYTIYVRDVSFLGFPAYHVFIPGMSEDLKVPQKMLIFSTEIKFLKKCLMNLKKASAKEVKKCISLIESYRTEIKHPYFEKGYFARKFLEIIFHSECFFYSFNSEEFLLSILSLRVGDYERAFEYLSLFVKESVKDPGALGYFTEILAFLRLKSEGLADELIIQNIELIFSKKTAKEFSLGLFGPETILEHLSLPECGKCNACQVVDDCCFSEWKKFASNLDKCFMKKTIDQKNLSHVFQH